MTVAGAPSKISFDLKTLLKEAFGFDYFRPHQEEACLAAAQGHDILLVMPTGAGKSLCYQLPGLARKGTTLVISPLVALMEDQVAKLNANGFRAERIHAGRSRQESRQVCADYASGDLDFLYVAPERLGVPGFVEWLARTKPALIAVDEAHCISQWGHDFRPDYRMLRERLLLLRPTPIMALTATATPEVQDDIVEQLGLKDTRRFVHGFRRTNIAIEVVEAKPSDRAATVASLLAKPGRLPAIIYAPTRKSADATASALASSLKVEAYHAGLPAEERERIQSRFIAGELQAIVATIAFGMGIDKADIRTVAHLALPASVEGYYQEIGRAGRDGRMSATVLLHSFSDRKTHEFFFEQDYPEPEVLQDIFLKLSDEPQAKQDLQKRLAKTMDIDTFDKALEKLWIQGGAKIDPEENITRGHAKWLAGYAAQRNHRQGQLAAMVRFAESHGCRMVGLVRHFGDERDRNLPCGLCDACAPNQTLVRHFRAPDARESAAIALILKALAAWDGLSSGKLFRDHFESNTSIDRPHYERILQSLVRAGLIRMSRDVFEKEGREIAFHRLHLTEAGHEANPQAPGELALPATIASAPPTQTSAPRVKVRKKAALAHDAAAAKTATAEALRVSEALRAWRLSEAKTRKVPAFCVFSDKVLNLIAQVQPSTADELLTISGIGPKLAERYGKQILSIIETAANA